MKHLLYLTFLALSCYSLQAQENYTTPLNGRNLEFRQINNLKIVGSPDGNFRIEPRSGGALRQDERARGMRKISASGIMDNTGMGISVQEVDGELIVEQVGRGEDQKLIFYVPDDAAVKIIYSGVHGNDVWVEDFNGALDVSLHHHDVILKNTYGPLAANTIHGNIEAVFAEGAPREEVRLLSSHGSVDVSLPESAKSDVRLKTSYGSMYTDFDLVMKANSAQQSKSGSKDEDCNCDAKSRSGMQATLNGGGPLLALTATYGNIYLRQN